ncbi:hypothetical protein [Azomonas macrocytogenes]|uniref:Uncharacterized protein n=1 Tax=Azomonas macrocytogenes TaxID=69962 RepID=A0A839T520_AZOMA|nr:hypothetical protein [Azomonas macrocytogenes]MBB3103586.1 hypothetical protein [Azomonas macrocytogenes]
MARHPFYRIFSFAHGLQACRRARFSTLADLWLESLGQLAMQRKPRLDEHLPLRLCGIVGPAASERWRGFWWEPYRVAHARYC